MQLQVSFMTLLAGIFVVLSSTHCPVSAFPLSERKTNGFVTLPLKQVTPSSSVHPLIQLQQHINRNNRRLARMTGKEAPSRRELEHELERRVFAVEGTQGFEKRYNRSGISKSHAGGSGLGARDDPETVTPAGPPSVTNSLGLDIEGYDRGYILTIQMGTPPQDFRLLVDTAGGDLVVGAENCQSEFGGGCGNHTLLGPQSSGTFVDFEIPFSISEGRGQVSGTVVTDNILVGNLPLDRHTFGVATTESFDFTSNNIPFDGVMGLAQSNLSAQGFITVIEDLEGRSLVSQAVMGYKISRLADNKNDGEITFGGTDTTKFDLASVVDLPNLSQLGFWQASMEDASLDGFPFGFQFRTAVFDTSATLMSLPIDDAMTIHAAIPGSQPDGQGGFVIPCNTTAQIALTFGGTSFSLDPRDLVLAPVDSNNPTGDCVSGISGGIFGGDTVWILGNNFFKNVYFSTDVDNNRMSLARLI